MTPREAIERADEIAAEYRYRVQLQREAFAHGHASAVRDIEHGRALGHDVGFGANTDSRGFVHAVISGFAAGVADKAELTELLLSFEPEMEAE